MGAVEIQAKATAVLMTSAGSSSGEWAHDAASLRLRDSTAYVYQVITRAKAGATSSGKSVA